MKIRTLLPTSQSGQSVPQDSVIPLLGAVILSVTLHEYISGSKNCLGMKIKTWLQTSIIGHISRSLSLETALLPCWALPSYLSYLIDIYVRLRIF